VGQIGCVILKGDTFRFSRIIKNGELTDMRFKNGGEEISGGEALAKLFTLNGKAVLSIYKLPCRRSFIRKNK